jgi:gluconate 2-dehydrogenase gamma chain
MSHDDVSRRAVVAWLATLPFARTILPAITATPFVPKFFSAHEWRTVRILADYVIPRDERSGSATDARVPEFMDFVLMDQPQLRDAMRGGLHWLDLYCTDKFGGVFVGLSRVAQTKVLDAIAYPQRATPEVSQGVAFFTFFRNLTASGFWTSKMGMADLQYIGNAVVHEWDGCPPEALVKLGVSYS